MTLGQFQFDGLPYFYKAQRALQSKFYIEAQRKGKRCNATTNKVEEDDKLDDSQNRNCSSGCLIVILLLLTPNWNRAKAEAGYITGRLYNRQVRDCHITYKLPLH